MSQSDRKAKGSRNSSSSGKIMTCGTCSKAVSEEGIECEICTMWFHYGCTQFTKSNVKVLELPGVHWYCEQYDHPNFRTLENRYDNIFKNTQEQVKSAQHEMTTKLTNLELELQVTLDKIQVQYNDMCKNQKVFETKFAVLADKFKEVSDNNQTLG